jgi:hypothetical protein
VEVRLIESGSARNVISHDHGIVAGGLHDFLRFSRCIQFVCFII